MDPEALCWHVYITIHLVVDRLMADTTTTTVRLSKELKRKLERLVRIFHRARRRPQEPVD